MVNYACSRALGPVRKTVPFGAVVVLAALTVAGCASRASNHVRVPVYQQSPKQVAGYVQQRREIEGDGIEAQAAPPIGRHQDVDDPTEPFSPNYGRFTALKRADAGSSPVYVPNDLPAEFRQRLAKSVAGS